MTIKIRFVTCDDPISALIRRAEYDFWASHAEAVMPDGTLLGAHADGGVEARPADYDAKIWTKQQIVKIEVPAAEEVAFYDFLRAQLGKPYDIHAVAAFAVAPFMRNAPAWNDQKRWFCSELITAALQDAQVLKVLAADAWRITPRDLLLILSALFPYSELPEERVVP